MPIYRSQVHPAMIKQLQELIAGCKEGESVCFFIYKGEVELLAGKRGQGYIELNAAYVINEDSIDFSSLNLGSQFSLKKKIDGSYIIGAIVGVIVTNAGQSFLTKTGLNLGKWWGQQDINYWEANQQRLNLIRMTKAELKNQNFDTRLRADLKYTRSVYKEADNITRQYMVAKIISYLNS